MDKMQGIFLHTCIHTCMHTYRHICIYTYIYAYIQTYMHAYKHRASDIWYEKMQTIYIYIYTYIHICMHTYIYACIQTQGLGHLIRENADYSYVRLSAKLKTRLNQIRRYVWDARGIFLELQQVWFACVCVLLCMVIWFWSCNRCDLPVYVCSYIWWYGCAAAPGVCICIGMCMRVHVCACVYYLALPVHVCSCIWWYRDV
jgi:hypothetical protein